MQAAWGLWRSILIYYGDPVKLRRMGRFYAQFIRPGDLCFDLGAHVGNRVWVWSRLDARVVAVEPDYFLTHYAEPLFEHGLQHRDRLRLALTL